jgi:hypothetical protein
LTAQTPSWLTTCNSVIAVRQCMHVVVCIVSFGMRCWIVMAAWALS